MTQGSPGAIAPHIKLWLEQDGQLVMSDFRVRLLELVGETGSLARAATAMGLSYRRAWGKVKDLEANLGVALVHSEVGGAGGGRTTLTPGGAELVAGYRRFQARLAGEVAAAFAAELPALAAPTGGDESPPHP